MLNAIAPSRTLACICLLVSKLALADTGPTTAADVEKALDDVLAHEELFDANYISRVFGLGFRVPASTPGTWNVDRTAAVATSNPPALLASGLQYFVDVSSADSTSRAYFAFGLKACPPLSQWADHWGATVRPGEMDPHGHSGGSYLKFSGPKGIEVLIEGCSVRLTQTAKRLVEIPQSPAPAVASAGSITKKLADALTSGDLRDYSRLARSLDTELIVDPEALGGSLIQKGSVALGRVMPGFDSTGFLYFADDTGWAMFNAVFVSTPEHLVDRTVRLNLMVDAGTTCISRRELETQISGGNHAKLSKDRSGTVYSMPGTNLVELRAEFESGCLTHATFDQITDVADSVGGPVLFTVLESLDNPTQSLRSEARRRLRVLINRLKGTRIAGIQIAEGPTRDLMNGETSELARLIKTTLLDSQVNPKSIHSGDADNGVCFFRETPQKPTVCVDVWR